MYARYPRNRKCIHNGSLIGRKMTPLTSLYGETVAGVGELVGRRESSNFHPISRAGLERAVAVAAHVLAVLRADREVLDRAVLEGVVGLLHLWEFEKLRFACGLSEDDFAGKYLRLSLGRGLWLKFFFYSVNAAEDRDSNWFELFQWCYKNDVEDFAAKR